MKHTRKNKNQAARISNISVRTAGTFAVTAIVVSAAVVGAVMLSKRNIPTDTDSSNEQSEVSSRTATESTTATEKPTDTSRTTTSEKTSKTETSKTETSSVSSTTTSRTTSNTTTQPTYTEQTVIYTDPPVQTTTQWEETTTTPKTTTTETETPPEQPDEITYINGILVVNKTYSLPADYAPGVDSQAQQAFNEMAAGAANDGISLYVVSGYRSYYYQQQLYNNYVYYRGVTETDRFSARPGHSEHQTGLAFDVNNASSSFENTPEAKWLEEHCVEYGFIIRYPQGKESVTGFKYEPWHVRYLGKENAQAVHDSGLCLEEYLGITSEYQ